MTNTNGNGEIYDYELEDSYDNVPRTPGPSRLRKTALYAGAAIATVGLTLAAVKGQDHEAERVDPTKSSHAGEDMDPSAPYAELPSVEMGGREQTPAEDQ